ncbi:MAG: TDT family transporter [Leptotrichiaceae bacterium]|nr:TDT family transporter [Leptotrichiaceae bacterium]
MKKILGKYPYPVSGLILGLAALGNLIRNYGEVYRNIFGVIATALLTVLILKIVSDIESFRNFLQNPVASAAFATAPMSVIILSTYFPTSIGKMIWFAGIVLNAAFILWFNVKFAFRFKIDEIFTTWSILYVGIVTASVTAPIYKMFPVGQSIFWFGFICYFIIQPIICYRVFFLMKEIPEPLQPMLIVFSAPISLLLAGYMSSFPEKNMFIIYLLTAISAGFYIYCIFKFPKLLKLKFYPAISAFTFPMVISATGMKLLTGFIKKSGGDVKILSMIVKFQEFIAVIIVVYVLVKYLKFMFKSGQS